MKNAKIVALAFCILFAGCVTSVATDEVEREYRNRYGYGERVGIFFLDLVNDTFLDPVQASFTFGPSWPLLNVHATKAVQFGFGWFYGTSIGLRERAFGIWEERASHMGVGPFLHLDIERRALIGTSAAFEHDYDFTGWNMLEPYPWVLEDSTWKEDEYGLLGFGGQAHIILFGASANVSVIELADTGISWLTAPIRLVLVLCNYNQPAFDIMGDDRWNQVRKELHESGPDTE